MRKRLSLTLLVLALIALLAGAAVQGASAADKTAAPKKSTGALKPIVVTAVRHDTSIPLRDMKPVTRPKTVSEKHEIENQIMPKALAGAARAGGGSGNVQNFMGSKAMPATFQNFDAQPNNCNCAPPDPNGSVGPNHYVSTANSQYQVFDKTGASLLGPIDINTVWSGFGGVCQNTNDGDPVVLYDHLADRWLISQFSIETTQAECVAISATADPTGAWHRYQFNVPTGKMPDYPKLGIWPDGYYMTTNQFNPGWAGAGVYAFERDQMLAGNTAKMVYFDLFSVNANYGGMLPSSLDGPAPPPGTPNYFAEWDDDAWGGFATDRVSIWEFKVDWTTPANSTFGISGDPNTHVDDTIPLDSDMCGYSRNCIPQKGTSMKLDAISDRLMHRLQYRYFGGYATLVGTHTVDADGNDHAAPHWFELRDSGSGWGMNQEGVYAPDTTNRWMASVAMDGAGNIAIGYSASDSNTFPSVRYAGRLVSDPAGTMGQGEATIFAGTHSQTGIQRWGDYSALSVDYSAGNAGGLDCDFWYTNEYLTGSGWSDWQTRVGAFTFAPGACGGPHGTISGTVTDSATTDPIVGAHITVSPGGFSTTTDGSGHYQITLGVGTYDVTATSYGYFAKTANNVDVIDGQETNQDFVMDPAPKVMVEGTVKDNGGYGYALYARINITGYPGGPVFTDPETGEYSVELVQDQPYTFNVQAILPGYDTEARGVTPPAGGSTEDFLLNPSLGCTAPGYFVVGGLYETFESGSLPAGWTQVDNAGTGEVWAFNDPGGRGNVTGGTGGFAIEDSDNYGPSGYQDAELRSPTVDLTGQTGVHLQFDTFFFYYDGETADVDVSTNGGSTWTNVWSQTSDISGHQDIDVSSLVDNQANVKVRFHYYDAYYAWYWEVDNVVLGNVSCDQTGGGLVIGNTYDLNSGLALNGVKVVSNNATADTGTSVATPDDPALDDGFYMLFSTLTGSNPFTASKNKYSDDTEDAVVVANGVVRRDFHLGSGHFVVTPPSLEQTVDLGTQTTVQLNIENDGSGSADYELQEGKGLSNAPTPHTANNVVRLSGQFSPLRHGVMPKAEQKAFSPTRTKRSGSESSTQAPRPRASKAAPWTDIANYPTPIMDSTAVEIDGMIYSVGGYDGATNTDALQIYDPNSNTWTSGPSMSNGREKPIAAAVNGLLYVTGGWDSIGNTVAALEIYDPSANSWSTGASIPNAYAAGTGVSLDGKFYVIGGCTDTCGVTDVQVYDPGADSWSTAASYPEPISWVACGEIGGQIYCAGGVANNESKHAYVYDPGADAWSPIADLPQTQWAMGYVASDSLLYISGGVTDNFATVTNEGFVYDPGADSWSPIEPSNNVVYRGASACGWYKIGGSTGGFSPIADSEVYPGLTNCGGVVDIPWLSENPTSGTVANGDNTNVDVTFDAAQVNQPGDYTAHLRVKNTTPYTVPDVNVTMHVPLPPGWGWLAGTVSGLSKCDASSAPLKNATVFVDTAGTDWTLKTGADGSYKVAFLASDSPVTITVTANGYVQQIAAGVTVVDGQTTTQDFTLRLDAPCVVLTPTALEATVDLGAQTTLQVNLNNTGAGTSNWKISEGSGLSNAPTQGKGSTPLVRLKGTFLTGSHAAKGATKIAPVKQWSGPRDAPWTDITDYPASIMDNTCADIDGLVYCVGGYDGFSTLNTGVVYDPSANTYADIASMSVEREKPAAAAVGGLLYVIGGWDSGGTPSTTLEIYDPASNSWTTGAPAPSAYAAATAVSMDGLLYVIGGCDSGTCGYTDVWVYDPSGDSWTSVAPYPEPISWHACAPISGMIYCAGGVSDANGESLHTYAYDPSSDSWTPLADMPQTLWAMGYTGSDNLLYVSGGVTDNFSTVTNAGFVYDPGADSWTPIANSNNTLYRGGSACGFAKFGGSSGGFSPVANSEIYPGLTNCGAAADVPWLSENPTEGTLLPGDNTNVDVTLDASVLNQPGDYLAHLKVKTATSDEQVTMHVPLPPTWGWLNGTVTGLTRCDGAGSPLKKATVFVDTADVDWTLETDAAGHYQVAFPAADSPVTITVSANGYVTQTISGVAVTAQLTTTSDFDLRLDAPCSDKTPASFDVTLKTGESTTLPFTLSNAGAGSLYYQIRETLYSLPPLSRKPFPARKKAAPSLERIGANSMRSQAPHGEAKLAQKVPSSGWFYALPIPNGVVRYAATQCATQPNSYYVISGVDPTYNTTKKAWRYDADTNSWNPLKDIPLGQESATATCYLGKIYVMGGYFSTAMYIYDIANNTWTAGPDLPRSAYGAASASWNNSVFVFGGLDDIGFTSSEVDVYDIPSNTWIGTASPMPTGAFQPGYVQVGPDVFLVGGHDDSFPPINLTVTQRYNMETDTWTDGPSFDSARADFALAATDTALYAMGGDKDSGGYFDPSKLVERLDYTAYPDGEWTDLGDPLPSETMANTAGFCTEAFHLFGTISEIYSVAGADKDVNITANNAFHGMNEHCFTIFSEIPWLSESPVAGNVDHDSNGTVDVTFDATGQAPGDYNAVLVITSNDAGAPQFDVPVVLHVLPCLFCDEFNDDTMDTNWTYTNSWSESGDNLNTVAGSKKATAIANPVFAGCQNCSVAASVSTSGTDNSRVWMYGWWLDKKNDIELLVKEANDKIVIKQRSGGSVIKKQNVPVTILPATFYAVTMTYDGSTIVVNVDGTDVMTFTPVGTVPSGTVGFGAKNATARFGYIHVN